MDSTNDLDQNIQFFFRKPEDLDDTEKIYSILFLLRRDIKTCFGINPNDNSKITYEALFPGVMAIMAGIDLLAKFYHGNDTTQNGEVGKRFKNYVKIYLVNKNEDEAKIIYQLRNSLLHSFGLYSEDRNGNIYKFILNRSATFIHKVDKENYKISIIELQKKFEDSIDKYEKELCADFNLQNNFVKMFPKYRALKIQ
ncbi:MAG TPA: hypothetical protein PKC40_00665 [Saprospiraceae bacterium]|nr:hypothetical protein [Saprospiraceae bacterium]